MQAINPTFKPNNAPAKRLNIKVPGMHHAEKIN